MELIKAPVTSLEISNKYLISGVGSYLKVYLIGEGNEQNADESVYMAKVLKHNVIHGIKCYKDKSNLIVFGGREWCICNFHGHEQEGVVSTEVEQSSLCPDWIWDASLIYTEYGEDHGCQHPQQIAFALGHNTVLLFDLENKCKLKEVCCEEKCILYSAHFLEQDRPTWESLLLCSGTVFNQVVIWAPGKSQHSDDASPVKVSERIHAHDGVIFDMNFDFASALLVTASDDRSIRIWRSRSLCGLGTEEEAGTPDKMFCQCLCRLYGHESRVWRARCVKIDAHLLLVSVGEDGCCNIWKLTQSAHDDAQLEGRVIKKMKCHKGRNIWSIALYRKSGVLATGGGDGGIRVWKLKDLMQGSVKISNHAVGNLAKLQKNCPDPGSLKSIHLCAENCIIAHSNTGALLRFDLPTAQWSLINFDEDFKSYAVLSVCDEHRLLAVGNTKGHVNVLYLDCAWRQLCGAIRLSGFSCDGKIHNLSWFVDAHTPYLFASGPGGEVKCFKLGFIKETDGKNDKVESHMDDDAMMGSKKLKNAKRLSHSLQSSWILPIAKHRWHMGVVMMHNDDTVYVICGDRRGSLHLFKQGKPDPQYTLHGIHGKNGVTSIRKFGDVVISTGRDGVWRRIEVNHAKNCLEILSQNKAAQGMDWLEDVICNQTEGMTSSDYILTGFHGRNFMAWSSKTGDSLLTVECGGGHRNWSFKILKTDIGSEKSVLAFLKASTLHLAQIPHNILKQRSVVEESFHGRQITCVRQVVSYWDDSTRAYVTFLATGSEDTKLFLSVYICRSSEHHAKLQKVFVMDDHISSIRALALTQLENTEEYTHTLLFSAGGRATINCYQIRIMKKHCWKEACEVEHTASHGQNQECSRRHPNGPMKMDPEMRYMALTAWTSGTLQYVAAACSDAVIQVFSIDLKNRCMQLTGDSSNHSHCFLTIAHFKVGGNVFLIAGATNGKMTVWRVDEGVLAQLLEFQIHMSGINALDVLEIPMSDPDFSIDGEREILTNANMKIPGIIRKVNRILVATGGDDNAIHLTVLEIADAEPQMAVVGGTNNSCAHSTQITGLHFIESEHNKTSLVSTSIDQRLTNWSVSYSNRSKSVVEMHFCSAVLSDTSDISSMETWTNSDSRNPSDTAWYFALGGQGLQVFKYSL